MLFAGILLFAGTQYGFCQRHVTYKGVCLNGNVEKVKKEMEKKGWTHFRQYNWLENTISNSFEELPPDYIPTSVDIMFSTKTETVSSMLIGMWYEKMDSVYNQLYQELVSTYPNSHSYTDGTTYFIVKNKKNKDIGLVWLKKDNNGIFVLIVDFKNHFKAIKEGGRYLEEFYLNLDTLSHYKRYPSLFS